MAHLVGTDLPVAALVPLTKELTDLIKAFTIHPLEQN
jgi:hypothetical protein